MISALVSRVLAVSDNHGSCRSIHILPTDTAYFVLAHCRCDGKAGDPGNRNCLPWISLKMPNYTVEFIVRWPTVSRFGFSNQPKPLKRNARQIGWLDRNGDTVDRRRMRDNHSYIAQVGTNRDRTCTSTRAIPAERYQPFSAQIGNSNLAQLLL